MSRLPPSLPLLLHPLILRLKTLIVFNISTAERGGLGKGWERGSSSHMTLSLCVSERHHAKSKRGGKDHGGGGIACVLRVSASELGSLKPFNKREEEKREGQLEEEDFGSMQPPLTLFLINLSFTPHPPIFSLLISSPPFPIFFFRHPLHSRSSFIYPFPPQSAARPLAGCVHALVFVGCTFH